MKGPAVEYTGNPKAGDVFVEAWELLQLVPAFDSIPEPSAAGERTRGLETTSATGTGFTGISPSMSRFLIPRGHAITVPFLPPQARGPVV